MEKLILWGNSSKIDNVTATVERFAKEGDIEVIGICLKERACGEMAYRYPAVEVNAPVWSTADCVLVCTEHFTDEDIREVFGAGAKREQLVPCRLIDMKGFSFSRYMKLVRSRISILSNVCWGGLTYHYFGLPFLSPTINLIFDDDGYIRFLENLEAMLKKEPVFQYMKYNAEEDLNYPVFDLGGTKIYMYHCKNREQGFSEWKRRSPRVNFDDLLVTMVTSSEEAAARFDALPFNKKVCFVPFKTKLKSCVYIDCGETPVISYVNSYANGIRKFYDPWILLEEGRIVRMEDASDPIGDRDLEKALAQAEGILIYGAWAMGTKAYNMIKAVSEEKLLGFAVTAMDGNPDEKYGYPVRSVEQWRSVLYDRKIPAERIAIFEALHPRYYGEVRELLNEKGFYNIFMLEELERFLYQKYPGFVPGGE